jgi:hypothetical protein
MTRITFRKLRWPLLGASAAALVLVTTSALAGSGVGGVFNLGQVNTVDAQSTLSGNPGGNPLLRVTSSGTGATIRADGTSGIAVNGFSASGTGQYGQSTSGIGLRGNHLSTTGTAPGVEGDSASSDPNAIGVFGRLTSATVGSSSAAVYGLNSSTGFNGYGVFGKHNGGGAGVYGTSPSGQGVYGTSSSGQGVSGGSTSGWGVYGVSGSGVGVYGKSTVYGVYGTSPSGSGVYAISDSGQGVLGGSTSGTGVWGSSTTGRGVNGQSTNGNGVAGFHTATTGAAAAVEGDTNSKDMGASGVLGSVTSTTPGEGSAGVYGLNTSSGVTNYGVYGRENGSYGGGVGVEGSAPSGFGVEGSGVTGINGFSTAGNLGTGVKGCAGFAGRCPFTLPGNVGGAFKAQGAQAEGIDVAGNSPDGYGAKITSQNIGLTVSAPNDGIQTSSTAAGKSAIYAHHDGAADGYGVFASSQAGDGVHVYSSGDGKSAVYGEWNGSSGSGWAGYFNGNLNVTGQIFAGTKDFRIDDPLDPAHKYLQHTSVESPDMMDIYNGNVTTDGTGFATVKLPHYFQALNRSFRYQLTSLSGLQEVAVAKEIANNQFTVQSQKPNSRVSWQVTGIRHDPYANANRTRAEVAKPAAAQGSYIHPELYGKPRRLSESRLGEAPVRKP